MSMATRPSSHTDWVVQQYQQHAQAVVPAAGSQSHYPRGPVPSSLTAAESSVVTTVTTTSPPSSAVTPSTQQPSQQSGSGGRGARPVRRRTRASRRAPTTLLNTDTTNFRAMVHQFTGAPPGVVPSSQFPTSFYMPGAGSGTSLMDFSQLPLQQQQQQQPQHIFGGAQMYQVQQAQPQPQPQPHPQQQQQQQQHHQQLLDGSMYGLAPTTTSSVDPATAAYFHSLGGGGIGDQRS